MQLIKLHTTVTIDREVGFSKKEPGYMIVSGPKKELDDLTFEDVTGEPVTHIH